MQTRLGKLRSDLVRLQNTRKLIRWANGFSGLIVALVVMLVVAFVSDITLDMSRAQRVILLGLVGLASVWAFRRFTLPWLRQSEHLIEVALLVEKHQRIDSDLVAALQFEQPEASRWGSSQLETAVVSRVAEISPKLDVFSGISQTEFRRRMLLAASVLAAVGMVWVAYPGYVNAFLSRLLLANAFYPTETEIGRVVVNGTVLFDEKLKQDHVLVPFGQPVKFSIAIGGRIPAPLAGRLRIQSLDGAISTDVTLEPDDVSTSATHERSEKFTTALRGELPRLMDSVSFEAFVGDARTAAFRIEAVPLPVVDVRWSVTPPAYASMSERAVTDTTGNAKWHLSVLEASKLDVIVECLNKDLESVQLWVGKDEYRMTPGTGSRVWTLNTNGTPLGAVVEPLEYRLQVTDKQGLQLESPIRGTVRLKQDQPPRIAVSTRTSKIIPTAKPPILFAVQDDYGISKVIAQVQIARKNGENDERELEVAQFAGDKSPKLIKDKLPLDISSLKLAKGDELKVTFLAYDYRGDRTPKRSFSEPLMFQVTDQAGILSGLLETDQESAKQLDAIIRRELGIGGQK